MMGLWTFQSTKEKEKENNDEVKKIATKESYIVTADVLFDQGLYKQLYNHLSNYKV